MTSNVQLYFCMYGAVERRVNPAKIVSYESTNAHQKKRYTTAGSTIPIVMWTPKVHSVIYAKNPSLSSFLYGHRSAPIGGSAEKN